jgi:hypothetical protein
VDILIALNAKHHGTRPKVPVGFAKNNSEKAGKISHEFCYWNIIVLSQLMGNA